MKARHYWILCVLTVLSVLPISAKRNETNKTVAAEAVWPMERAYLTFDNTSYCKGERIWYSAWVTDDATMRADTVSRLLYVELVNSLGYPVETQHIRLEEGRGCGSFLLSDTLNAGFYEVRAYTTWMLNSAWERQPGGDEWRRQDIFLAGNAGIFSRVFPVYDVAADGSRSIADTGTALTKTAREQQRRPSVTFYPEGGSLVEGVAGRVAIEVRDGDGRLADVTLELSAGKSALPPVATRLGRAVVSLPAGMVSRDRRVTAALTVDGERHVFTMAAPERRGYTMGVTRSGDGWQVLLGRNSRTRGEQLRIDVTSRGRLLSTSAVDMTQQTEQQALFTEQQLGAGVNVATLSDARGNVLARRLFFVRKQSAEPVVLTAADTESRADGSRSVTLRASEAAALPIAVSVTDAAKTEPTPDNGNIWTYLLLSSELRGYIPDVAYYFQADDAEHVEALDELMMVQGWTRYDYGLLTADGAGRAPLLQPERDLCWRGRFKHWVEPSLRKPRWEYPSGIAVSMTVPWKRGREQYGEVRSDSAGMIAFSLLPFAGQATATLRSEVLSDRSLHMQIEPLNAFSPMARLLGYEESHRDGLAAPAGSRERPVAVFPFTEITAWQENVTGSLNGSCMEAMDYSLRLLGFSGKIVAGGLEQGGTHAVLFANREGRVHPVANEYGMIPALRRVSFSPRAGRLAAGMLQGVMQASLSPRFGTGPKTTDAEYTDLASTPYQMINNTDVSGKPDCLVVHYSDRAAGESAPPADDGWELMVRGITEPVDFYRADYSSAQLPDQLREARTLLWLPLAVTQADGTFTFSFMGNGGDAPCRVTAEGITADGRIAVLDTTVCR